ELLRGPQRLDGEGALAVFRFERAEILYRERIGGERPQPHLAANAVRRADPGDAHPPLRGRRHRSARVSSLPPPRPPGPPPRPPPPPSPRRRARARAPSPRCPLP